MTIKLRLFASGERATHSAPTARSGHDVRPQLSSRLHLPTERETFCGSRYDPSQLRAPRGRLNNRQQSPTRSRGNLTIEVSTLITGRYLGVKGRDANRRVRRFEFAHQN
jgi:hypothetical protein